MLQYRPFLNTDPPRIVEIWRAYPPSRSRVQSVSVDVLERHVFSKPYFDRQGLIMALDDDLPVGFVHAGFGASEDQRTLDKSKGVTAMIMVLPHPRQDEILEELLGRSEQYQAEQGAREIYGGGCSPLNPFYIGLYGGCQIPGILSSDPELVQLYERSGYEASCRKRVLQRQLAGFRPKIDRAQMLIRRKYRIEPALDPAVRSWWEACTYGNASRTMFRIFPRQSDESVGEVIFWDMEPLASSWGVHANGLLHLDVSADDAESLATFLVGEAFRQIQSQGVKLVEVQCDESDQPALAFYQSLGFEEVDCGTVYRKK